MELAPAANQTPGRALDDLPRDRCQDSGCLPPVAPGVADGPTASGAARARPPSSRSSPATRAGAGNHRALVKADPQDRESRMGVAAALAALQRNEKALTEYEQISADWPDFPFAYIRQGFCLRSGATWPTPSRPTSRPSRFARQRRRPLHAGLCLPRTGQLEQAVADFEAGLALDPSRESARQALDELSVQLEVGEQP